MDSRVKRARIESLEPRRLLAASFAAAVNTPLSTTSAATLDIVVGDFNGDHVPDLIGVREDQTVEAFFGSASGKFTVGPILTSGAGFLAAADFNKDGNLDLVTGGGVLLGKGDGTLSEPTATLLLPADTFTVLTGDFNTDGNPDIAAGFIVSGAAGQPSNVNVAVLLGNGDGSFKALITTTLGTETTVGVTAPALATGDFNKDGKLDVLSPFGVSLGNGDGTLGAAKPLPTGAIPTAPPAGQPGGATSGADLFAVADFNGDGIPDVAVSQADVSAASLVILTGKGDGTLTVGTPASLGSATTITALNAADVDGDGHPDLLVGAGASRAAPGAVPGIGGSLLVLSGAGDGTFAAPTSFAVTGAPVSLATADFNADGKPDVVSLAGAAGGGAVNGQLVGNSADVLLNTSTTTSGTGTGTGSGTGNGTGGSGGTPTTTGSATSTVSLAVSPGQSAFGTPVQLTARVAGSTATVATGTVTFFDGTAALGTATLRAGKATLVTTALGFGMRSLTAVYSGDATYATATSAAVSEDVLVTTARVPFLTFALGATTLTTPSLAGDHATIQVIVQNLGGGVANGSVGIELFLTQNGTIDPSAVPLAVRSSTHRVNLGRGQSEAFMVPFSMASVPAARYVLAAQLVAAKKFTAGEITTGVATASTPVQAAGDVFGTLGTHSHLTFTVSESAGQQAVFSLSGPGMGTLTPHGNTTDVSLTGTTAGSVLRIATHGGDVALGSVTVSGALARFDGPGVDLTGVLRIDGGVGQLVLGQAGGGGRGTSIALGAGPPVALSVGTMNGVTLQSAAPIRSLSAASWTGGAIIAPQINRLTVSGAISGNVFVHNDGGIQSIRVGSIAGGAWAVPGGFTTLRVTGSMSGAMIFAGVDAGADNVLDTSDDSYRRAAIGTIQVGGSIISSIVAAGAMPASGTNLGGGLVILPRSPVFRVTVGGVVSQDSRILGKPLAARIKIGGSSVTTGSDPRFSA